MSWPVWELLSADRTGNFALQVLRMVLAVVAVGLIVLATRSARADASLRRPAVAVNVLLAVVLLTGVMIRLTGSDDLGVPYSVATVGLLWALVLLASRASLERVPEGQVSDDDEVEASRTV